MPAWTSAPVDEPTHDGRPVADVPLPGDPPPSKRRCICGRRLTDPISRARGLGPKCYRRLHGAAERRPAATPPPPVPGPAIEGQAELPLTDQPALWSL
ncbi:DUF6011 domain-containing protein [Streptomyces sp. BH097]|uniref:DUF6011 domain-containing protein n=1 Tax=unclassified Streptomyces TaxID=2593676 RepID=UPI003BB57B94